MVDVDKLVTTLVVPAVVRVWVTGQTVTEEVVLQFWVSD